MPTLLLPHVPQGTESALAAARHPRRAAALPSLRRWWAIVLLRWRTALEIALAALALAFLLGHLPLPEPLDTSYRSCARIVALLFLGGALAGAPGVALSRSRIGAALLVLALAATASVVAAGGRTAAVSALWTALGVFHAVRAVAADERGRRRLLHGLGLVCVGILARELWHEPRLLVLREAHRHGMVTEHPNTLGFALALLLPVLLAASARRSLRAPACVYVAAGTVVLLATFSRAAWLGLAGSVLALAFATRAPQTRVGVSRVRRSSRVRTELALVAAAVLVLAVAVVSLDRNGGDTQRLRILGTSWSLFREHWPLGVGFGSGNLEPLFPVRYLERHGESLFLFHSHDLYLDLLTGSGVAGAVAAVALFATLATVAWRALSVARHRAARAEAAGYATSLGVFFALGLVDTPLYHGRLLLVSVTLWAMLDVFAECSVRSHEPKKTASDSRPDPENSDGAVRRERHRLC
ncbi:MAG: O-antigen ligase family protein [Candidatus Binatia bacterium]